MKTIETLLWILDKFDNNGKMMFDDDKIQQNIDFVHSLGLKCDSVGWNKLSLQSKQADEILTSIEVFCKESGFKARGYYSKSYTDYTSDWFVLEPGTFKDNTLCDYVEYENDQGERIGMSSIRAYHELHASPKWWGNDIYVPERFRDACVRHNITDVDFFWVKDKGKYKAEQYFYLFGNRQIPVIAVRRGGEIMFDRKTIEDIGGYLPRIADIFYDIKISLQDCYLENEMPDCMIANAFFPRTYLAGGQNRFLIHKSFANILLNERAISSSDLFPAMLVKEVPGGYSVEKTSVQERPSAEFFKKSIQEYERLKSTERPSRAFSEKEALSVLRSAKTERKGDFRKSISKELIPVVSSSDYSRILPYYKIANGGYLSDEYELLSYEEAAAENSAFAEALNKEEQLEEKLHGLVFAKCIDGDKVLLGANGNVFRFSHEVPEVTEEWNSLAQFFVDAVSES